MICAIVISDGNEHVLVRCLATLVEGITQGVLRRVVIVGPQSVKDLAIESGCDFIDESTQNVLDDLPNHNERWMVIGDKYGLEPGWSHELESKLLQIGETDYLRFPCTKLNFFTWLARLLGFYKIGPALVVSDLKLPMFTADFVSLPPYKRVMALERRCFGLVKR